MNNPLLSDRAGRRSAWSRGRLAVSLAAAAVLVTSTVLPAYAALDPFPSPNVPSNPPGNYAEQVLASNGYNAIDPVLGKYYRIVALADVGDGVLLASYDGRPDGGDSPSANSIVQRQHRRRKDVGQSHLHRPGTNGLSRRPEIRFQRPQLRRG